MDDELADTTVGRALTDLGARHFIGRARELAVFEAWLHGQRDVPEILNLSGPGGVGKTELLRAFCRIAEARGFTTLFLDGRTLLPTADDLLRALGGGSLDEVLADLNARRPILVLDTAEELGDLTGYLHQQLLPRLDVQVRTIIAGRYPLGQAWLRAGHWRTLIRPLPLEGFSASEARAYLTTRGLADASLIEQIRQAAGGYPLALSLAADLATQYGVRSFVAAPEWRLAVRTLVEQFMSDLDAETRALLDACSVVREFDQSLLEEVTGQPQSDEAFGRLCDLSMVRPGPRGLMLHDDVRRVLSEDLRWRRRERYAELRLRALAAYRSRMRSADAAERGWLVAERLSLWEHAFVQAFLFAPEEPGQVWLAPAMPADHDDVIRMEMIWHTQILPTIGTIAYPPGYSADIHKAVFVPLISCPGRRLTVARDRDGQAIGFGLTVPLTRQSAPILLENPTYAPVLRAHLRQAEFAALPGHPDRADRYVLAQAAHIGILPEATHAALFRDLLATLTLGRVYYVVAGLPAHRSLWESLGFELIPGAESPAWIAEHDEFHGYVLDLRQIGFEGWIEAVVAGRRPPRTFSAEELEEPLDQVLKQWGDDEALASSPLLDSAILNRAGVARPSPDDLRRLICETLALARADAPEGDQLAYTALELAYLEGPANVTRVASNLAVSRATFYRLLRRGVSGLASCLAAARSSPG